MIYQLSDHEHQEPPMTTPPTTPPALDPKDARAQLKAAKAYQKAQRPWFKKKRFILPLALVLLIVLASAFGGGSDTADTATPVDTNTDITDTTGGDSGGTEPAAEPAATEAAGMITLEVGGTATGASITYTDGGTQTSQETSATVPWSKQIPESDGFLTVYQVLAQNAGGGDITCKITGPDGEVLAENVSSGDYAIATCNTQP